MNVEPGHRSLQHIFNSRQLEEAAEHEQLSAYRSAHCRPVEQVNSHSPNRLRQSLHGPRDRYRPSSVFTDTDAARIAAQPRFI